MKKIYSLMLLAVALACMPFGVKAEELTVADGTNTNEYVPVYGNWADAYQRCQVIYPASDLSKMTGKTITQLTFYLSTKPTKVWSSSYKILLSEVEATTFSNAWNEETTGTEVYAGTLDGTSGTLTITFANSYTYNGGNLLLEMQDLSEDAYSAAKFYGVGQAGNTAVSGYSSSSFASISATNRMFIPKTTFAYEEPANDNCPAPTALTKGEVTANSAAFSWTASGEETEWQYIFLPVATELDWASEDVKTATSASVAIEGLEANTAYKFYVRANCGGENGESTALNTEFTTPCEAIATASLPYVQTFEDVTTGTGVYNIPEDCWKRIEYTNYSGNTYPYVASGSSDAYQGSKYLYMYGGGSTSMPVIILPTFESGYSSLTLSFWYKNTSTSSNYGKAQIGYITDPTDASTFTVFSDGTLDQVTEYTEVSDFSLAAAPAGSLIAIRLGGGSYAYQGLYIDNITVAVASGCTKPAGLTVSGTTPEGATLIWEGDASQYQYGVVVKDADAPEEWTLTDAKTATISSKTAGTAYDFYVRAYCSESEQSNSVKVTFTPVCPAPAQADLSVTGITTTSATFAWAEVDGISEYEYLIVKNGDDVNWEGAKKVSTASVDLTDLLSGTSYTVYVRSYYNATSVSAAVSTTFQTECDTYTLPFASEGFESGMPACWSAASQWAVYTYEGHDSSSSMRFNASTTADLTLPTIALDDKAQLTFWRMSSYVSCAVYVNDGENVTQVGDDYAAASSWTLTTVDLSAYAGKTVTIIIRGSYYGSYKYLYIDDVAVNYAPVAAVTNVVAAPANGQAVVTWECAEEGAKYSLQYRATGAEEWTLFENITEKTYTIESLTNGTTYEVQVKAVASANRQSEWTASATVKPVDCASVTEVTFGAATYNSVVVNWIANAAATWTLQTKAGEAEWATVASAIAENTYTLNGLTTGTEYSVRVKADCADDEAYVAAAATFAPAYSTPATATIASIADATATASWSEVADAPDGYKYAVVAKDAEVDWDAATATDDLTASLTGLEALTEYDFYVAAVYGENLGAAKKVSFTTITVAPKDLAVSEITANAAKLSWENDGAATAYEYATGEADALVWNEVEAAEVTLSGLTANTSYTAYVRAKYSDKVKSDSVHISFRTDCNAIAELPWFEGFEDMAVGNYLSAAPACWAQLHVNDGLPYAYVNNTSYVKTGSKSMNVVSSSLTDGYLILPAFDAALNGLQISFSHKEESATRSTVLTLGYITDIANAETFVAIKEFGRATSWQEEKEISLASIPNEVATTARLAFKLGKAPDNWFTGIDDITVAKLPSCRKPVLGETTILPDGATFTWTAGGDETKFQYAVGNDPDALEWTATEATEATVHGLVPGNNYTFYVRAFCDPDVSDSVWTAFAPVCNAPTEAALTAATTNTASFSWTAAANITSYQYVVMAKGVATDWSKAKTTTNTTAEWTELAANTAYDFYVRSYFNETVQSAAASLSFRTECAAVATLPWSENFEDQTLNAAPACWALLDAQDAAASTYPYIAVRAESGYYKDAQALLFRSTTNVGYAILPEFDVDLSKAQISFTHKEESGKGTLVLGYLTDIADAESFDTIYACASSSSWTDEKAIVLSEVPAGARLAFQYNGNAAYYYDAAVDNILIEEIPACAVPTGLAASEVTAATATLSWTSEAANFKVQYTTDKENWGEEHVVTATTLVLENLTEQTTYYAHVKAVCSEESESEYCEEISFTTPCAAKSMPYAESFEDGVPACWTSTGTWTTNSEYAHSGNALRADVKNKVATLTMPAIAISEADAELVFYVRNVYYGYNYGYNYVSGEVIITPTVGEAKHVDVINSADINNKQKVDLSEFNGKNVVISFSITSVSSTAYVYIDDVTVAKKQCATPTDVQATSGDKQADVTWTAGEEETAWQLQYKATAAVEWTLVENITSEAYSITGLVNGTEYEVQVRAYCDETHQSEWTESVTFTPSEATGFESINGGEKAVKVMKNGVLYIIRDGVQYNAQGAMVIEN